jgi:hypothetical protein
MENYYIGEINENGFYYSDYKHGSAKAVYLKGEVSFNNFVWHIFRSTREHRKTSFKECAEWVKSINTKGE